MLSLTKKGEVIFRGRIFWLFLFFIIFSAHGVAQVDNDFWFVVPELSHRGNTGGTPGTLRIATMELEATVTISMPANAYNPITNPTGFQDIVVDIPANSSAAVDLTPFIDVAADPTNNRLENKALNPSGINNFGLHITATNMITAYWEINYDYGSDLWTLKGSNGLGTLFYTPFQTAYDTRFVLPKAYSAIDVVATQDNTQITFTLPPGKAASFGNAGGSVAAGGTKTITLNRGETFSLFPFNFSGLATDRLNGTKITSNLPIGVVLKDDDVFVVPKGQDVVGDQIVPVSITGNNYIVYGVWNPSYIYVLATEDNTPIYLTDASGAPIGATPYATLNEGEQLQIKIQQNKYTHITSSLNPTDPVKPFYTFQLGAQGAYSRGGALVPAVGCTGNTQLAFTRARDDNFYFYIITEDGNQDKFLVDGVRNDGVIDPTAFVPIGGTPYVAWFSNSLPASKLSVGQHLVQNTGGIFHLAILNGFAGAGNTARIYYGYYSDFGNLNIGATVAGTNSYEVRACYGDPVQLYAYGGTVYSWTPDLYLDDATSNMPTAVNLPPGDHNYTVAVSGACGSDSLDIIAHVAPPVDGFFETDVLSGCAPLDVVITDGSTGTSSWQYDLGDGSPLIRYDLDPATPYPQPPGYPNPFSINHTFTNTTLAPIYDTITLLAKNASGCSDIVKKTIVIYPEINSDFTVDVDRGCQPLDVSFQNTSSGDTATWVWDFGDGGSSVASSPSHTFYNLFGPDSLTFQTRLVATSPYYCRDTTYHNITVMPYIEASFAFDTVAACSPHEFVITDQSFGADTYFWDFGDGTTSTTSGPTILKQYTNNTGAPITYTISLRVENDEGCVDTLSRQVTVYPEITAAFVAAPVDACSPFEVVFQNNSVGASTYLWDFGDGGTSIATHPTHLYDKNLTSQDTTYLVTLIATSAEYCTDTAYLNITVHPYIEADFTVDDIIGCHPFTVTINNQSFGVDQYTWDFGDGTPVSNTTQATFQHTYLNNGSATVVYPLKLIVENSQGCTDTLIRDITVHPEITANFTADAFQGCHPLTVNFTDLSLNPETWLWDFGDGGSSIEASPSHTFYNFGTSDTTYIVTLITSTADGECVKSISFPFVVHPYVESIFTTSDVLGCNPFTVELYNHSLGGTSFTWDLGDGTIINTADTSAFSHTFVNTDVVNQKDFEIVLQAQNASGCTSESRRTVSVYPDIVTQFSASATEGCHPLDVDFTNLTQGGTTYTWEFGDGTSSNLENPSHRFTNTGTVDSVYTVTLHALAANNACSDTFSVNITVHPFILADFTLTDILGCTPFDVVIENASLNASIYRWDFGDGTDTITTNKNPIVHRFTNSDYTLQRSYVIKLVAENAEGCTDSIFHTITVEPDIRAAFAPDPATGCNPLVVDFTNLSQGATYYDWDFGNGTTSSLTNPTQLFTNSGVVDSTYHVWLTATASNYICKDSAMVDIVVHPYIDAYFTFMEDIQCTPASVTFYNASTGGTTFHWDFGDGSDTIVNNTAPITHIFTNTSYVNTGTYQVTLTAENGPGCSSQIIRTVEVYPDIRADFTPDVNEGCHPLVVTFNNNSSGAESYQWDFNDGTTSFNTSPVRTFTNLTNAPVTRQVQLIAISRYYCKDTLTLPVTIHPKPLARFETDKVIDCAFFDVPLKNTSLRADQYSWIFGDGVTLDTTTMDTIHHIYDNLTDQTATYNLEMIAASTYGCTDTVQQKIYVYPRAVADFVPSEKDGCNPVTVFFSNTSVRGDTYLWDFGDGSHTQVPDPTNVFYNYSVNDTSYTVNLLTRTKYGCTDTHSDTITVYPQPLAEFIATPTLQIYPDATVNFDNYTNDGFWNYQWNMGDGFTTTLEDPAPHTYNTWGSYNISLVASSLHCTDTVAHSIRILPTLPLASFDSITPGCEPLTVQFTNNSLYADSYLWEFDDGTSSTAFEPVHTFDSSGLYNVKLTIIGDGGIDYAYRIVEVYPNPVVNFRVQPDLVMLPDQGIKLFNLTKYGDNYLWDFGDGNTSTEKNPFYIYSDIGVYTLALDAWNQYGCHSRLEKPDAVTVLGKGLIIFPNAFVPDMSGPNGGFYDLNGYERNNIFHPYWEGVETYRLEIYDRWGELLYVSEDVNIGWDGYYKGKLCKQDVYVYKCTGTFVNGKAFRVSGDVTLLHHNK